MSLGFGTVAYFDIHKQLAILFAIMLLLALPSMYLFAYSKDGNRHDDGKLHAIMIGNLGFSSSQCKDTSLAVDRLTLACPAGVIGSITSFGLIPSNGSILDACLPNDETKQCDYVLNHGYIRNQLELKCLGQPSCTFQPNLFFDRQGGNSICTSDYAQFYTQVLCKHTTQQLITRQKIGIWLCIQAILTAVIYLAGIYYIKRRTSAKYEKWDQNTTTISDYTVLYEIPEQVYRDFSAKRTFENDDEEIHSDKESNRASDRSARYEKESKIYAFKKYLKREIEAKLLGIDPVIEDDSSLIRVSEIVFMFDNTSVINMLIDRGNALDADNDDKAQRIENKIKMHLKNNWQKLSIPKEAYVTFKTEEAYLRAITLDSTKVCWTEMAKDTWRGAPFVLKQVQEPSNIYWENKRANPIVKIIKQVIVVAILTLILFAFMALLFYIQKLASKYRREYPEVDCEEVEKDVVDKEMLKQYALTEWFHWQRNDGTEESVLMLTTANLQCYCEDVVKDHSRSKAMKLEMAVNINGERLQGKICSDYLSATRVLFWIQLAVPILIIVSNSVIKHGSIILSRWLRFEQHTNEISMIQILCFFMLFFNNALSILLINARFKYLTFVNYLFDGDHPDFDGPWYRNIAPFIISPMYIQIIFPIQNIIPDVLIQQGLAWLDRRFTNPKLYKTNCKTALQYADLNSGPEHLLFEKYPRLVNIVMLSMMYAFGLPIFLVLTLICLVFSYFIDKLFVAYYHRKPPLYDDSLNVISVHFLKWGAFVYLAIAYWMISNRQIFGNDLSPKEYQDQIPEYHHYFYAPPQYNFQAAVKWAAIIVGV